MNVISTGTFTPQGQISRRLFAYIGVGVVILSTVLVYLPALRGEYVWRDFDNLPHADALQDADGLRKIWLEPGATEHYRPLTNTTLWLEYQQYELDPRGYHLCNLLGHIVAALLVWAVLACAGVRGGFLAAMLFALHPIQAETVTWISQRGNVLAAVLGLASLLCYLWYDTLDAPGPRKKAVKSLYCSAIVLFAGALLCNAVVCSLPVVVLLMIWYRRARITAGDVVALLPFVAMGLAMGVATIVLEHGYVSVGQDEWALSWFDRVIIAGRAVWFYLGKLLWPVNLTAIYPRWAVVGASWQQVVYPLLVLLSLVGLFAGRRWFGRGAFVAASLFVLMSLPMLGFFDMRMMEHSFVADHYTYMPNIAVFAFVGALVWQFGRLMNGPQRAVAAIVPAVLVAGAGFVTWKHTNMYLYEHELWRNIARTNPTSWLARYKVGNLDIQYGLARSAIAHYRYVISQKNDHYMAHYRLGMAYLMARQPGEAEQYLRRSLELSPNRSEGYRGMAQLHIARGEFELARKMFERAMSIDTDDWRLQWDMAHLALLARDAMQACVHLREVIRLQGRSASPDSLNLLAWILAVDPDAERTYPTEAIVLAQRAVKLTGWRSASIIDTLAAAYANAGQYDKAVEAERRALQMAKAGGRIELVQHATGCLELYEQHKPYRERVKSDFETLVIGDTPAKDTDNIMPTTE